MGWVNFIREMGLVMGLIFGLGLVLVNGYDLLDLVFSLEIIRTKNE